MNKTKWTLIGVTIMVVVAGLMGYSFYQGHYLSSDLRRTLSAAMDGSATENDIMVYLRDARLQVRTRRDADVLQGFEKAIQLAKDANDVSNRHLSQTMDSLRSLSRRDSPVDHLLATRSEYLTLHIPVPKSLDDEIDREMKESKVREKQEGEIYESETKRADSERETAGKLYNQTRTALGLQPIVGAAQDRK